MCWFNARVHSNGRCKTIWNQYFFAGRDRSGLHLFQVDPSGAFYELKAGSTGKGKQKALQSLERRYKDDMSLDDGLGIVLDTLREGFDGEITEKILK